MYTGIKSSGSISLLNAFLGKAHGRKCLLQRPKANDHVFFWWHLAAGAVLCRDVRGGETALGLNEIEYVVHELLGKPLAYIDRLCLSSEQTTICLQASLLSVDIAPRLCSILLYHQLQLGLFKSPLKLFWAQIFAFGSRVAGGRSTCGVVLSPLTPQVKGEVTV
ncbi:hypothetical protein HYQ46_012569 [Verticillium longisporum]|nr:hypothetical protein HYQ46_012569 [Verticillium longisporum]